MRLIFNILFILSNITIYFQCSNDTVPIPKNNNLSDTGEVNLVRYKKIGEIPLPEGFIRIDEEADSFGEFLRSLPLKTDDNKVYLYNGKLKTNQYAHFAVLELDIGDKDLQQCADAIIRLRAEYLFQKRRYDEIHFNFVSGDKVSWNKFKDGYRTIVKGNKVSWVKLAQTDTSYENFRKYLELVFTYAGTASLIKELKPVKDINDIRIGDIFIQTGVPFGHAVMVMDIAEKKTSGKKIFLLGQSYMPAQNFHILKNPSDSSDSPWYGTDFGENLVTPEWIFVREDQRRFE